jgi:hypothetical protein
MTAPRHDWFDRLARAAAGRMSRRDAVGVIAGTTVMAILGSWVRPIRAFGRDLGQGKDPGCSGIRTFYRAGCPKPVPKLKYPPPVNGCGPQNGFNPVPQTPLNLATFTPACDEHDRGYGTCNRPKAVTDTKFLADMKSICGQTYPVTGLWSAMLLVQCARNAEIYYTAVSTLGDDPYKEGQEAGCDCCDECPGGATKCSGECCRPGRWICGASGKCCEDCQPGWIKCPYPNEVRCGFGCCMPGSPICCPGMTPGSLRCCNGKCYKGGCG